MRSTVAALAAATLLLLASTAPQAAAGREAAQPPPLDAALIERVVGVKPAASGAELKVSVPQSDLAVSVDGFAIVPAMGLTSWVGFAPAPGGAMVMGDLVLLEEEVGPVQRAAVESGLAVTAIHHHFVRDRPKVAFMHVHGAGPLEDLARGVRAALDTVRRQRRGGAASGQQSVESTFDPRAIDRILGLRDGQRGTSQGGVYKVTLGRPDVRLLQHGVEVSSFLGFNTWMAFQGTAERAAVAGDFAMLEAEVAPVIAALARHGLEVAAVHNHMVGEEPRIVFLHFWGVGPVEALAQALKAGLDRLLGPGGPRP
ncbi:MAG TPA: DUF1259 domain-containing protein [Thermoanaerobaculia bacterium]